VVEELLSLKSTCQLWGDIRTNKLAIEPGAKFTGSCNMDGSVAKKPESVLKNETVKA